MSYFLIGTCLCTQMTPMNVCNVKLNENVQRNGLFPTISGVRLLKNRPVIYFTPTLGFWPQSSSDTTIITRGKRYMRKNYSQQIHIHIYNDNEFVYCEDNGKLYVLEGQQRPSLLYIGFTGGKHERHCCAARKPHGTGDLSPRSVCTAKWKSKKKKNLYNWKYREKVVGGGGGARFPKWIE